METTTTSLIDSINFDTDENLCKNMSRNLAPITSIDILNQFNKKTKKPERFFIISKRLFGNALNEVLMFDMNSLERYNIELSMQFLIYKYPTFIHHYFVLVTEFGYNALDQHCNNIGDLNQVISFNIMCRDEDDEDEDEEDYEYEQNTNNSDIETNSASSCEDDQQSQP